MQMLLVPLDGSECADQVLRLVIPLARALEASVHLLRVVDEQVYNRFFIAEACLGVSLAELREPMRRQAEQALALPAEELRAHELTVTTEVIVGHPAQAIAEVAQEQRAAMIAMATHGHSGFKRWALGSVTDKIVHIAPIPVAVVRSTTPAPVLPATFRRILVPLDESNLARQALPLAERLARAANGEILLLEVLPPDLTLTHHELFASERLAERYREEYAVAREQTQQMLEALAHEMTEQSVRTRSLVCTGEPATSILHEAEQWNADLIVMATHGYTGVRRWMLGSVADKVLHATTRSLVLVPARTAEHES